MIHFFRASSWSLDSIRSCWFSAVRQYAPLYKERNLYILVGDGVKQSKEGRRMPGVKKLFQESENSAKPEYIHGHMFGGFGILAGNVRSWACIPLSIRLHDGLQAAMGWKGAVVSGASHVVQMVEDAYHAARIFGDSLLLLDRYFLTVPALERLQLLNSSGNVRMEIVTKAKKSAVAFEKPAPRKPGRGRPPKKGAAVHLKELFISRAGEFQKAETELYGKKESIRYYCIDLLWGQKLYQELRFVLVEMNGIQSILVSTSLTLEPLSIIRLYSCRFRIECTFRELKQQVGAFCYHFWSKHMPRLNYYQKKEELSPLECVEGEKSRKKILAAVRAIEMHMALSCIAMGSLQSIANPLYWKGKFLSAALSENTFKRKSIRSHCHELSEETFFPPFRSKSRITYNANNSRATERVRNLLGFTGFLVVQTFYSQVILNIFHILKIILTNSLCHEVCSPLTHKNRF